jgi:hypothetical protein
MRFLIVKRLTKVFGRITGKMKLVVESHLRRDLFHRKLTLHQQASSFQKPVPRDESADCITVLALELKR